MEHGNSPNKNHRKVGSGKIKGVDYMIKIFYALRNVLPKKEWMKKLLTYIGRNPNKNQ